MYNHQNTLGRLQYAQAGEKKYMSKAVARTVDTVQAKAHEESEIAAAAKVAKKATKSVTATKKPLNTAANAAGLKAAASVKGGVLPAGSRSVASQKASATASASAKATIKAEKGRTAGNPDLHIPFNVLPQGWLGDPEIPTCVPVAIANHLLLLTGLRLPEDFLAGFCLAVGYNPSIGHALKVFKGFTHAGHLGYEDRFKYELCDYASVPVKYAHSQGLVVGYESSYGPHAALSLGNGTVVSWGQEIPEDAPIEEAWMIDWAARRA
jgi:hypothetical protein